MWPSITRPAVRPIIAHAPLIASICRRLWKITHQSIGELNQSKRNIKNKKKQRRYSTATKAKRTNSCPLARTITGFSVFNKTTQIWVSHANLNLKNQFNWKPGACLVRWWFKLNWSFELRWTMIEQDQTYPFTVQPTIYPGQTPMLRLA